MQVRTAAKMGHRVYGLRRVSIIFIIVLLFMYLITYKHTHTHRDTETETEQKVTDKFMLGWRVLTDISQ